MQVLHAVEFKLSIRHDISDFVSDMRANMINYLVNDFDNFCTCHGDSCNDHQRRPHCIH